MIIKESLGDLQEKYEKVRKLLEEDARFDQETDPYFSKYSATTHLKSMNAILENLKEKAEKDSPEYIKLIGMQGVVNLQLGIIAIETEELCLGEKYLLDCYNLITAYSQHKQVASCHLNVLNHLGLLYSYCNAEQGKLHLEQAEQFYKAVKTENICPIDSNNVFIVDYEEDEVEEMKKFEKLYTLTLYYFAQVFAKEHHCKSAVYFHHTLQRQLESGDFEIIDWILNTATLSQFMMGRNGFHQARHHLSASSYMLDKHKAALDAEEDSEEHQARLEVFKQRSADIARFWGNYGIGLLLSSRERLLADAVSSACTDFAVMYFGGEVDLTFPTLDVAVYEKEITDKFVLTLEDAKPVFLHAQRFLLKSQEYYTLETLATDFIRISDDHALLYGALAFYEELPENRTKLLKRAIDILEHVLTNVNPTDYMEYCRTIWFQVAMLYSDIHDIKLDKIKDTPSRPTCHALTKLNKLIHSSIENFTSYTNSFRKPTGQLPQRVDKSHEKAFLQAMYHVAMLELKKVPLGSADQMENERKSLDAYKWLVDYCSVNEGAEEEVKVEMSVVREMVVLLPLKISKSV